MSDCCGNCEGDCGDTPMTEAEVEALVREGLEQLISDLSKNPDLAAKLFITLKMAAEPKR
jgi:hypothetical protein